ALCKQRRATFPAEPSISPTTGFTDDAMIFRLPAGHVQGGLSNQRDSYKSPAARLLTVLAMTIEHGKRRFHAVIADGATTTAALIGNIDRHVRCTSSYYDHAASSSKNPLRCLNHYRVA